jgi:hypothetical protein
MTEDERALQLFGDDSSGRLIRRQWYAGRWFVSVIDVLGLLTESQNPRG